MSGRNQVNWEKVDWTLTNGALAKKLGVTSWVVMYHRKKLGRPKVPAKRGRPGVPRGKARDAKVGIRVRSAWKKKAIKEAERRGMVLTELIEMAVDEKIEREKGK